MWVIYSHYKTVSLKMQSFYVLVVFFLIASEGRAAAAPQSANGEEVPILEMCPKCPKNPLACHTQVSFNAPCLCYMCLTRCYARNSVCEKGESCILEDVYYDNTTVGQTAVCKPFEECPKEECSSQCSMSGFFVDVNGCQTCLCVDPCKELKCKGECHIELKDPGMEPYYFCAS